MKLKEIEVGKTYAVKVPESEDAGAYWDRVYGREIVYAEAVEVGVHRQVPEYMTLGGIAGTPRIIARHHESERADGIVMRLVKTNRMVTITANAVRWRVVTEVKKA